MNEQDIDLDQSFDTQESETSTEETTPEPTAPQYATRADLDEIKALLIAQQKAERHAVAEPDEDDDEFTFVTKKDFKQLVSGIANTIAPIQESASKAERAAVAQEHGIDIKTLDELTEGLQPGEVQYFLKTPAFANAARKAASSGRTSVKAPRAANTNGGDTDPYGWLTTRLKKDVEF
jgi:hypothetical protein